jgi:PiT family inorganic phosphate transporter
VGATVVQGRRVTPIVWSGIWQDPGFIFVSPLVGFLLGGLLMVGVAWVFRQPLALPGRQVVPPRQLVAAGAYSLGHGGNDAQKTIGIIWLLLITTGASTTA